MAFDDYEDAAVDPATAEPTGHPRTMVRVCEVPGGRELWNAHLGPSVLYCLGFSRDGGTLALGDRGGDLEMRAVDGGSRLWQTKVPSSPVFRLAFSPDGRTLAGADRSIVRMWDLGDGREILILRGAPPRPFDGGYNPQLSWSPDGGLLASLNWDGSISIWNGSETSVEPADRRAAALGRVFAWHLDEAEAAVAGDQADAASFHFNLLRGREPPDSSSLRRRGQLAIQLGDAKSSRADFDRWLAGGEPDQGGAWPWCARAYLIGGDRPAFRWLCTRLLDAVEKDPHDSEVLSAAHTLGLAPCPPAEADRLIRLVKPERLSNVRHPHLLSASPWLCSARGDGSGP
ncbi:MAG TPA: hypothetical protein VFF52_21350 [Isosphaeraceae bacterium]|nr:hypothetical protein [Isosphaeraceae bacterium]